MAAETEMRALLLDWLDAYVVGDSGLVECAHATVEYLRGETPKRQDDPEELRLGLEVNAALAGEMAALRGRLREHEEALAALRDDLAGERSHVRTLQQELEAAQRPSANGTGGHGHITITPADVSGPTREALVELGTAVVRTLETDATEEPAPHKRPRYGNEKLTGRCVDCGAAIQARSTRCRSCQGKRAMRQRNGQPEDPPAEPSSERECRRCGNSYPEAGYCPTDWRDGARICSKCRTKDGNDRRAARRAQRNEPAYDPTPVALVPEVDQNHVTTKPREATRQDRLAACVAALRETAGPVTQELMGALSVDHGLPICDVRAAVDQVLAERKGERRCTECNAAFRPQEPGQERCRECRRIETEATAEAEVAA